VVRKKIEALQPSLVQAVQPSDQKEVQPLTAEGSLEAEASEQPPLEQAKAKPSLYEEPAIREAVPEPEKKLAYAYDPKGKLDPFQPIFVTQPREATKAAKRVRDRKLPRTPLQKIDVSQLKVSGIIIDPTGNKALAEDPSGKGYVITKGTYVGSNFGRVKKILKDRIIVEEEVEDAFTGQMTLQPVELRLQKKFGE